MFFKGVGISLTRIFHTLSVSPRKTYDPPCSLKGRKNRRTHGMVAKKFLRVAAAAAIVLGVLCPRNSEAQVLYGSVVGSLQDQSGGAVPNATLTVTNRETGQVREVR